MMPCKGRLVQTVYIPGKLFSVNDTTAASVDGLFARNERLVCEFETEFGPMVMVLVGAMIVAGIETVWKDYSGSQWTLPVFSNQEDELVLDKGEEMGRFKLGSTVILLFGEQAMQWENNLQAHSALTMGSLIGSGN